MIGGWGRIRPGHLAPNPPPCIAAAAAAAAAAATTAAAAAAAIACFVLLMLCDSSWSWFLKVDVDNGSRGKA